MITRCLILLFIISCKPQEKAFLSKNFEMEITLKAVDDQFYSCEALETIFDISLEKSEFDELVFNIFDFSYQCNNFENTDFQIFKEKRKVYGLKKSHFLIENELNEFKIFDESIVNSNIDLVEDCGYRDLNNIEIRKSRENKTVRASTIVCKQDLQVRTSDKKVRIWYYYNTSNRVNQNKSPVLIKSNWIEI